MEHTEECLRQQEQAKQAQDAYRAAWPRYCCFCNGKGGLWDQENVAGKGDPPIHEQWFEPCPVCLQRGRCPRCGEQTFWEEGALEEEDFPCCECGWKNNVLQEGLPTIQCICDVEFP